MGWPVAWLKRMMDAKEFDRWCEYYRRRPFDDENVHQTHIAQLTALFANANRAEGEPPRRPSEFLLYRPPPTENEQAADLDHKFKVWASKHEDDNDTPA